MLHPVDVRMVGMPVLFLIPAPLSLCCLLFTLMGLFWCATTILLCEMLMRLYHTLIRQKHNIFLTLNTPWKCLNHSPLSCHKTCDNNTLSHANVRTHMMSHTHTLEHCVTLILELATDNM